MGAETTKTILLVEDDAIIAMKQAKALQRCGYEVVCASSGGEAVEISAGSPAIDLVLMDINLGPGIDGTQAAKLILDRREIPVVFLSAHSEPEVVAKTEGITSYGFVVKSAGTDMLNATINMAFKLHASRLKEKETIAALRKSEERFALAMEATRDGLWDWNVETGHVYYSPRWKSMLGYADDEIGDTLDEWERRVYPEDRGEVTAELARLSCREARSFMSEHRLLCKDGSYMWVLDRGEVVEWTDDGRPRRIIGTHSDITDRKRADASIRRASRDWEQTFDAVPDLIAIVDANHIIRRANRAMAERCGLPIQAIIGRTCHEVLHGTLHPSVGCPHARMMLDGAGHLAQIEDKSLNAFFEVSVSPIRNSEGLVTSCVHVARDVTARVRAEAYRGMGQGVLLALQDNASLREAFRRVVGLVKSATGVDAVGIRLQDGDDYPYFHQEGFPRDFLKRENSIHTRTRDGGVCRNDDGSICLECTCGLVIAGKTDPGSPLFTRSGSCWTNDSSQVLHVPASEDPRNSPRNECIHQGYASVALVPIRAKGRIVGLLQLNDHRKGCFTIEEIEALEGVAENMGEALLRKQAEQKLVASEERFRLMFERHGAIMMLIDPSEGAIVDVNESAAAFYGYTRAELLTMNIRQIQCLPPEQPAPLVENPGQEPCCHFVAPHRLADGTIRTMEVDATVIDAHGKPMNFAIFHDITERVKAEAELRESNDRFRVAFETFPGGLTITDLNDGVFIDVNSGFEDISGYTRGELIGSGSLDLSLWHDPEDRARLVGILRNEGVASRLEVKLKRKDGGIRNVSLSGRILRIKDKPLLFLFTEDITERYRAEEERKKLEAQLLQAQKMEAVGQLAGGIAHDFNNLLTAIIGYGQVLRNRIPPESQLRPYIQMVIESGEKAAGVTQGLLAFSRKQVLNPKPIGVCETILGFKKMLERIIREDIEFSTMVCEKELMVMADRGQLEQVLMNLVTNANDAMPQGGALSIEVSPFRMDARFVHTHGFGKPGRYACVTVADTGCGMDEETKDKLFEPFFTTKEPGRGTGLGMSIVYGIVRQHNGYIHLCSEPGRGTAFFIYLPLLTAAKKEKRGAELSAPRGGTETLLMVEDDEVVRQLHQVILEGAGYAVITAVDGRDALDKFAEHGSTIDMVVTDVIMPKLDGHSLSQEIRRKCPGMKVLFMSGYTKDIVTLKGITDEGMNYLEKPVRPPDLLATVRKILDQSETS